MLQGEEVLTLQDWHMQTLPLNTSQEQLRYLDGIVKVAFPSENKFSLQSHQKQTPHSNIIFY